MESCECCDIIPEQVFWYDGIVCKECYIILLTEAPIETDFIMSDLLDALNS